MNAPRLCWHCLRNSLFARFTLKAAPVLWATARIFHFLLAWGQLPSVMIGHLFSVVDSAFFWDSQFSCRRLTTLTLISDINFSANSVDFSTAEFIERGEYNRYWPELVSPMLPIQPVARLSSPTPNCFFIRISPLRKKCRPFVSPWRPLQGVCPTQGFIWYSDNQNVEPIIFNGSRIFALQAFQIPGI